VLAARQVEGQSSQLLKAKHKQDPRPQEYVDAISTLLAGARIHDLDEKTVEWVKSLSRIDSEQNWRTVRQKILDIYHAKIESGSPGEPSETDAKKINSAIFPSSALTAQQTTKVYQNLGDEAVAKVFAAVPRDYIVMTYIDQGRDVAFEQASPGQQASALLELLLKQSAGTLIIDQPEDDLDNRVIMKIVNLLRASKSKRQLLFATHNPNIVVNGDADKVIVLKSGEIASAKQSGARIQIDVDGAIETPSVRDAITHVMEGGKEAFDLRSRKYNFQPSPGT
jgi:chromosome segregation protein